MAVWPRSGDQSARWIPFVSVLPRDILLRISFMEFAMPGPTSDTKHTTPDLASVGGTPTQVLLREEEIATQLAREVLPGISLQRVLEKGIASEVRATNLSGVSGDSLMREIAKSILTLIAPHPWYSFKPYKSEEIAAVVRAIHDLQEMGLIETKRASFMDDNAFRYAGFRGLPWSGQSIFRSVQGERVVTGL